MRTGRGRYTEVMTTRGGWRYAGISILIFILPLSAGAQSFGSYAMPAAAEYSITVSPQFPSPFSTAILTFLSNNLDLANASLTVAAGGKQLYHGDVRSVSIPLGGGGVPVNVSTTITQNGQAYPQTVTIIPQDVSLVLEPLSSAPPLYLGKPLVPLGGQTRLVAVADLRTASGKPLNPADLSYLWTVDGTHIANASGIGKDALVVGSPLQYRDLSVSVSVESPDGTLAGSADETLTPVAPTLRIYENDPLRGIRFSHALSGSFAITSAEASLYAAPFSFPTTQGAPSLTWFLNGSAAQSGGVLTLRPTGAGKGSANVSATASSGVLGADAAQGLTLTFGQDTSSLFGL